MPFTISRKQLKVNKLQWYIDMCLKTVYVQVTDLLKVTRKLQLVYYIPNITRLQA